MFSLDFSVPEIPFCKFGAFGAANIEQLLWGEYSATGENVERKEPLPPFAWLKEERENY
jgi:hypothetical protein